MRATAVIGANWGDEGKGLLTDFFSNAQTTVIRYNGGAQAGHTVCRDGKRHVFHHFGSGSLVGASTYLSQFFISNPILYFRERTALHKIGIDPKVSVDPYGPVTTPYEMMINQMVEEARGDSRHGSCGLGINETIKRHARFPLFVADLAGPDLKAKLLEIRQEWVSERLNLLGVTPTEDWQKRLDADAILEAYIDHCQEYIRAASLMWDKRVLLQKHLVFEGAQGLLLDEDHYFFPHVTHSHTGLPNVMAIAYELGITGIDVVYVTRAYLTRHGAGPFPREETGLKYEDETNIPNAWQGNLRFGHLDLDLLYESVQTDQKHAILPIRVGLAITHLDQVGDSVLIWQGGKLKSMDRQLMMGAAYESIGAESRLGSFGPSAATIRTEVKQRAA